MEFITGKLTGMVRTGDKWFKQQVPLIVNVSAKKPGNSCQSMMPGDFKLRAT